MVISRLGVLSVGKIMGCVYGLLGLIPACFFFVIMMVGFALPGGGNNNMPAGVGAVMGLVGMVAFPIFYGLIGFLGGLLASAIYNLIAGYIGGIEIEFAPGPGQSYLPDTSDR